MTRCVAPVRTAGGVLSCVQTREGCDTPAHRRWDRWAPLLEVVWRIKPWWPNALGRAQDRGEAHTPYVHPCRHCERLAAETGWSVREVARVASYGLDTDTTREVLRIARESGLSPFAVVKAMR